jgi:hypothetical protein
MTSIVLAPAGHTDGGGSWMHKSDPNPPAGGPLTVTVWADNDRAEALSNASLLLSVYAWNSTFSTQPDPLLREAIPVALAPFASTVAPLLNLTAEDLATKAGCAIMPVSQARARHEHIRDTTVGCTLSEKCSKIAVNPAGRLTLGNASESAACFVTAQIVAGDGSTTLSDSAISPVVAQHLSWHFEDAPLQNPHLNISAVSVHESDGQASYLASVTVTATAPAAYVWLETPLSGRWSDNGFFMTAPTRTVEFEAWGSRPAPSAAELRDSTEVWSLYDVRGQSE